MKLIKAALSAAVHFRAPWLSKTLYAVSVIFQLQFLSINNQLGVPTILIDDGSQPPIKLSLKDAKVVVATFTHFLLRNIGKRTKRKIDYDSCKNVY